MAPVMRSPTLASWRRRQVSADSSDLSSSKSDAAPGGQPSDTTSPAPVASSTQAETSSAAVTSTKAEATPSSVEATVTTFSIPAAPTSSSSIIPTTASSTTTSSTDAPATSTTPAAETSTVAQPSTTAETSKAVETTKVAETTKAVETTTAVETSKAAESTSVVEKPTSAEEKPTASKPANTVVAPTSAINQTISNTPAAEPTPTPGTTKRAPESATTKQADPATTKKDDPVTTKKDANPAPPTSKPADPIPAPATSVLFTITQPAPVPSPTPVTSKVDEKTTKAVDNGPKTTPASQPAVTLSPAAPVNPATSPVPAAGTGTVKAPVVPVSSAAPVASPETVKAPVNQASSASQAATPTVPAPQVVVIPVTKVQTTVAAATVGTGKDAKPTSSEVVQTVVESQSFVVQTATPTASAKDILITQAPVVVVAPGLNPGEGVTTLTSIILSRINANIQGGIGGGTALNAGNESPSVTLITSTSVTNVPVTTTGTITTNISGKDVTSTFTRTSQSASTSIIVSSSTISPTPSDGAAQSSTTTITKMPKGAVVGGAIGGIVLLGVIGFLLFICRRRRRVAAGNWGMIDAPATDAGAGTSKGSNASAAKGPRSPRHHMSLTDAEIQSWRPDRGSKMAPFVRVTSTLVRIASMSGMRRPSMPGTPTTPTTPTGPRWAPGRPASVIPPVPALPVPAAPVPAMPVPAVNKEAVVAVPTRNSAAPSASSSDFGSWAAATHSTESQYSTASIEPESRAVSYLDPFRDSRPTSLSAPMITIGEEDTQEIALDKDWTPPASRIRRKEPKAENPFADPKAPAQGPPRLSLNFNLDAPSRLSTVSDDMVVPAGQIAGVAM